MQAVITSLRGGAFDLKTYFSQQSINLGKDDKVDISLINLDFIYKVNDKGGLTFGFGTGSASLKVDLDEGDGFDGLDESRSATSIKVGYSSVQPNGLLWGFYASRTSFDFSPTLIIDNQSYDEVDVDFVFLLTGLEFEIGYVF